MKIESIFKNFKEGFVKTDVTMKESIPLEFMKFPKNHET